MLAQTSNGSRAVSLDVRADGPTQVLSISNYEEDKSLYKLRRRGTSTPTRQDSVMGSEAFEAVAEEASPAFSLNISLEGLGISLINKEMTEVVYLSVSGFKFEYANSPVARAFTLSVEVLQIDNQLHEAIYPVVLQPTPVARQARK